MSKSSAASAAPGGVPHSSSQKWLPANALCVDPEAQRKLDRNWVKNRVSLFDAELLGCIVVNRRKDGKYRVLDGQHRLELIRTVGWGDQDVMCEVFEGYDQKQEALMFLGRNDARVVKTFDKFRVRITSGDPVACDIQRIVREAGMSLSETKTGEGHISSVVAMQRVYKGVGIAGAKDGPVVLAHTLYIIKEAWGRESRNFDAIVIEAIGMLLTRYGKTIDRSALISQLIKLAGGAVGLISKARGLRDLRHGSIASVAAGIMVERYNRGRRAGKLESWWS